MNSYIKTLNGLITERQVFKKELSGWRDRKELLQDKLENLQTARKLVQTAAKLTQDQISLNVSETVTKALKAVFTNKPYEFVVKFVERRNVVECDLLFKRDGHEIKPLESSGYGAADIASLALRAVYWMIDGRCRNTLILDEPTRNLDKGKQPLASKMIRELSKMGIQFIIVTHKKALTKYADRVFRVIKSKFSKVEVLK